MPIPKRPENVTREPLLVILVQGEENQIGGKKLKKDLLEMMTISSWSCHPSVPYSYICSI